MEKESAHKIPKKVLHELSKLNQFKSTFAITGDWVGIIAAANICEQFFNPFLYIVTVFWIAARMHGLGVLLHEGVHYRLYRNRKLNNIVSELLAWSISVTAVGFKQSHLAHHANLNTDKDPNWVEDMKLPECKFPQTKSQIFKTAVKYLSGLYILKDMKRVSAFRVKTSLSFLVLRYMFYFCILAAAVYFKMVDILIMFWLVPFFTVFLYLLYIRQVSEHHAGLAYDDLSNQNRTLIASWWESLMIAPHNINYHTEHHLYPSVPFYNLPKLHKILMENPGYKNKAHITYGFKGLLKECLIGSPTTPKNLL